MVDNKVIQSEYVVSCGNVFEDLGLPNADEELAKATVALAIRRRIHALNLSQTAAAKRLGTDQAKVSRLMHGKIANFSMDRLLRFINALAMDVHINISPTAGSQLGKTLVHFNK